MSSVRVLAVAVSMIAVASAAPASSATVSGKEAAAASAAAIALPAAPAPVVGATIARGKRKRLLVVHATIQEIGIYSPGDTMTMYPTVNGLGFEPDSVHPENTQVWKGCKNPYSGADGSGDYPVCGFTGTWWLDLDAAEAANPGALVGQPLAVSLNAAGFRGNVANANVSMTVQMIAK